MRQPLCKTAQERASTSITRRLSRNSQSRGPAVRNRFYYRNNRDHEYQEYFVLGARRPDRLLDYNGFTQHTVDNKGVRRTSCERPKRTAQGGKGTMDLRSAAVDG